LLGGSLRYEFRVAHSRLINGTGIRHFGEASVPGGNAGRAPTFELYPGIHLTTEEKSRKNLSQGNKKVPVVHDSFLSVRQP
jgi:hypothetical protein